MGIAKLWYLSRFQRKRLRPVLQPEDVTVPTEEFDIVLVGAGAMSTTLGMILQQLDPNLRICMVEKLDEIAVESTDALNNAGTGHAGYCELNYTPQGADGKINASKAFKINAAFEVSLAFWSHLVEKGILPDPDAFIRQVPHLSFVWGEDDVRFLRNRYEALKDSVAFGDMEFSDDPAKLREWVPLIMNGRTSSTKIAATRVRYGADVDFGALARTMTEHMAQQGNFDLRLHRAVEDLTQQSDRRWIVKLKNTKTDTIEVINAGFVFLGAGGGALPLLQQSGIPEAAGYGGFPVGGQWLICKKPEVVEQHTAKVYGKAALGAPPMSVPHLDTRVIDGQRMLLFGPFAGFTTRYLIHGSLLDLPKSLALENLIPMISVGINQLDLTMYLVSEVLQSQKARVDSLRRYFPEAADGDWELAHAGKRVQIIKKHPTKGGSLEFGTEVVSSADGTLAALLGASPGASTSVQIMLDVLERCFPTQMEQSEWPERLREMIPCYGKDLNEHPELFREIRQQNLRVLGLDKQK
ncbi:MAG: malate dehydrogenase (quinone) [Myxococcales bacterium]|nr:malate dehydrogenase (quinone) [Myxococcales bacterium]